jgi:Leucine-rich repeat (LRR) protein
MKNKAVIIRRETEVNEDLTHVKLDGIWPSISHLPFINNVKYLDCSNVNLKELPELPVVRYLNCSKNMLKTLPELNCVEHLDCSENWIEKLKLFPFIEVLNCSQNKLKEIPNYEMIYDLNCSKNFLTKLVTKAKVINCAWNKINILECPNAIEVDCSWNLIEKLPQCEKLKCKNQEKKRRYSV